jgi:VanZ family protein
VAAIPRPILLLHGTRALFWAAILFTFVSAALPATHAPHLFPWDKAEHFAAFFVLSLLAAAAYPRVPFVILALWLSLFGCAIELVQALPIINRDCDIWDWVADSVGIGAAVVAMLVGRWRDRMNLTIHSESRPSL